MFVKSTRFKQVCQLLLSLIVDPRRSRLIQSSTLTVSCDFALQNGLAFLYKIVHRVVLTFYSVAITWKMTTQI